MKPRSADGSFPGGYFPLGADLGPRTSDLGLFLHASSVVMEGRALLFLGHSTAGKSTIARRLGEVVPVLADDSVYAFRGEAGEWRVVDGGFRFEDEGLSGWQASVRQRTKQGGVPLGACLRLQKAQEARLEPLFSWQMARFLMDAAMEIDVQRKGDQSRTPEKIHIHNLLNDIEMRKTWFKYASDLAKMVPGGQLWFKKHENGRELAQKIAKYFNFV